MQLDIGYNDGDIGGYPQSLWRCSHHVKSDDWQRLRGNDHEDNLDNDCDRP